MQIRSHLCKLSSVALEAEGGFLEATRVRALGQAKRKAGSGREKRDAETAKRRDGGPDGRTAKRKSGKKGKAEKRPSRPKRMGQEILRYARTSLYRVRESFSEGIPSSTKGGPFRFKEGPSVCCKPSRGPRVPGALRGVDLRRLAAGALLARGLAPLGAGPGP